MTIATSPVVVRTCLGVYRQYRGDDPVPVHLIFRASTGGLHILAMDEPTAMAAMLAIRADVPADPEEVAESRQRDAVARTLDGMAVWQAGQGDVEQFEPGQWQRMRAIDATTALDAPAVRDRAPDRRIRPAERAAYIATFTASFVLGLSCFAVIAVAVVRVWGG